MDNPSRPLPIGPAPKSGGCADACARYLTSRNRTLQSTFNQVSNFALEINLTGLQLTAAYSLNNFQPQLFNHQELVNMKTINGKRSAAAEYVWPYFFSLPAELRLEIYRIHFLQDIYRTSKVREGNFGFRFYDLLLANRQIYKEAQHVARRHLSAQLQESQQTLSLYQKQVGVSLGCPTWSWVVGTGMTYHPKNLNPESLAALRLPMLGLSIYETEGSFRDGFELDKLSEFCCKLRTALDKEGATRTLELHFTRKITHRGHQIFGLLFDMRVLLSPPVTYSVTIVDYKGHRVNSIRAFLDSIGCNAHVRCPMPPSPLLGGFPQ